MGAKPRVRPSEASWRVYVVACSDGSLYTGIARDVERRLAQHDSGRGARYTRGRGPVRLLAQSAELAHGDALRLELAVKRLPAGKKPGAVAAGVEGLV